MRLYRIFRVLVFLSLIGFVVCGGLSSCTEHPPESQPIEEPTPLSGGVSDHEDLFPATTRRTVILVQPSGNPLQEIAADNQDETSGVVTIFPDTLKQEITIVDDNAAPDALNEAYIQNNAGTLEFKNKGGAYTPFGTGGVTVPGETTGDLLYFDGADWTRLPKGTAGQVLEMNIGATLPEWGTDDGGAGATTFLGMTDTPGSYTTTNALYTTDGTTPDQVIETTIQAHINGGSNNLYVGPSAGASVTTAYSSTGFGVNVLTAETEGNLNTAVGHNSLYTLTTGYQNVGIGQRALFDLLTGWQNTCVGNTCLENTTGNRNTALGLGAGFSNVTGSRNIFIGYQAGYSETGDDTLYIDSTNTTIPLIYGDFSTDIVTINDDLVIGSDGKSSGTLKIFSEQGGTDYFTLFQPGTQTQDITYTLPVDDGDASEVLSTDGAGVLSWVAAGVGSGDIEDVGDCSTGACFTAADTANTLYFEGTTDDTYETLLIAADTTTIDKTITLPDLTGTVVLSTTTLVGDVTGTPAGTTLATDSVADNEIDYSAVTLTDFDYQTAWQVFYSDAAGDVTELTVGADGTYLRGNGVTAAPTWAIPTFLELSDTPSAFTAPYSLYTVDAAGTAIAEATVQLNNIGSGNVLLGGSVPVLDVSSYYNVVLGHEAMGTSVGQDPFQNVAIGWRSMYQTDTAYQNVAIGDSTLLDITDGYGNIAIGTSSGANITTGYSNVLIGNAVGDALTTETSNTLIGTGAGGVLTGSGNVMIGSLAGSQAVAVDNKLYIDNSNTTTPLIYGDFSTDSVTINSNLNVATALTEGGNAVYNSTEVPGGELGGTWASPTVDSGIHDDEYIELADAFVGDVTGTYDATTITAGVIIEPDLNADNAPTDGDLLTYDLTGTNFAWITQNAGTDVTADLEEEGQINITAITGNMVDNSTLIGTGANTAGYQTLPSCSNETETLGYNTATGQWVCNVDAGAAGGMSSWTVQADDSNTMVITEGETVDFEGELGLKTTAATGSPEQLTIDWDYAQTLAGNPALGIDECIFSTDGAGGGILCEGTTADTNEVLLLFKDGGADITITLPAATDTLVGKATTDTLTNKTIDATNTVTINASDITDLNGATDITADLEEETHASEHAVSGADTVFPADPNADRYLMWDDAPAGELVWTTVAGGTPAWSDITAAAADHSIAFAGYEQIITSSLDEAAHTVLSINHTDADVTAATTIFQIQSVDDADPDLTYIKVVDNSGTPNTIFEVIADGEINNDGNITSLGTIEGATLTEGGNAIYNSSETPGGELGGTWASPTVDSGIHDDEYQGLDADLTTLATPTNWSIFHSNGAATITELTVGADGTYLRGNGVTAAPTWATPTFIELSDTPSDYTTTNALYTTDGTTPDQIVETTYKLHGGGGANNQFFGVGTGISNTVGGDANIAIGEDAFASGTSADSSIIIGYSAASALTTGSQNIVVGHNALDEGTVDASTKETIAIGYQAAQYNYHYRSTYVGSQAGRGGATGVDAHTDNVGIGYYALTWIDGGDENACLGTECLGNLTTGNQNTVVGHDGGRTLGTGSGNIFIGYQAGYSETGSNTLYIDNSNTASPLIYGDFATDTVTINSNLNVATALSEGGVGVALETLANLASVAINTSLISDTANTDDLGTEALYWKQLYLASSISFEGSTDDEFQTTLTVVDPTTPDKTITLPDLTGTVILSTSTLVGDVSGTPAATTVSDLTIASEASGDVLYFNGSNWVRLAKGTAGQVLEMDATGTYPEWDLDDSGGATLWDAIGDPAGDGTVDFTTTEQLITSAQNSANKTILTIQNTVANPAQDTWMLDLHAYSDGDANLNYFRIQDDTDGTPNTLVNIGPNGNTVIEGSIQTGEDGLDGSLIIFAEQTIDRTITINPNAAMTQDVVYTLPANDGDASQFLQTNGSGVLTWATGSGTGDVESVGDCADGACYDGSVDGGTYARIYDGDSHYLELNPGDITANRIVAFSDHAGTVLLSGHTLTGDITATFGAVNTTATALGVNVVDDTHIDWGAGAGQVDADDISDGSTNAIVTLTQETNWDTAFGWGDHSGLYALPALSNLAAVAVSESLISDTANTDDLGSEAIYWKKLYLTNSISFEGDTDDSWQTTLVVTDTTTSDKTITIPDRSGTVILSGDTFSGDVTTTLENDGDTVLTVVDDSHNHVVGNIDAANSSVWAGQINDEEGTGVFVFSVSPTLTTPTLGVASSTSVVGTITLAGNPALAADDASPGANGIIFEGATADTIELLLKAEDPAATDKTLTLQNITGTIYSTGGTDVVVADGGTGAGTFTQYGALYGNATGAFLPTAAHTTNGTLLIGDGSGIPTVATLTGTASEITVTNGAGSITLSLPNDAGTDISADLEEETHASEHLVSAADTIFPADPDADQYLMWDDVPGELVWTAAGAGYTNLTEFVAQTAWRLFYSNNLGDVTELAFGADGTYLMSNGAAVAPTFEVVAGGGGDQVIKTITQASHGFAAGDVLYLNGATYTKAKADAPATAEVIGMIESVDAPDDFDLVTSGYITVAGESWVAGSVYFLSEATAGDITTDPSLALVNRPVLVATGTTTGWILPYRGDQANTGTTYVPRWSDWSASRTADDTITSTTHIDNGTPVRYRATGGTWRYGIVVALSTDAHTIDGYDVTVSDDDEFQYGNYPGDQLDVQTIVVAGNCTYPTDPYSQKLYWQKPTAYLVRVTGIADTAPTGTQDIDFNVEVGEGNDILSTELVITAAATQVDSNITIDADYEIAFGELYYVATSECGETIPGGNPLTFTLTFVIP